MEVPLSTPLVTMKKSPLHVLTTKATVPFTLRFWFKLDSLSAGIGTIFALGVGWFVQTEGGGIFINGPEIAAAHPPFLFSATDWNYFVGGFDGQQMFAFLNDSPRALSAPIVNPHTLGSLFRLSVQWVRTAGLDSPTPKLDEVALWKDRVLSDGDVAADYNAGAGVDFSATDQSQLLAYWELEGTTGANASTLVDSLNGYTLNRVDYGGSNITQYGAGKFGNGLVNGGEISDGASDGSYFESTDPVFTFGDA
jgi:hypothetical protein